MSKKSLVLHLFAHHTYLTNSKNTDNEKYNSLFSDITLTYLPLLNMFANLEADGIPFKISMTFSPSLCSMLSDPIMQQSYIEWLDKLIALGESEVKRNVFNKNTKELAENYLQQLIYAKRDFTETLNQDILSKIDYYAKRGNIELVATTATNCFLPHYIDLPEVINAQIEIGLQSHKKYFNTLPEGFYLPFLGYTPGLEHAIKAYGLRYTILDSHALLFGTPTPKAGTFAPVRCENSLAIFAKDVDCYEDFFGENGIIFREEYCDNNRDIGFESKISELQNFLDDQTRLSTGFKYWCHKKTEDGTSLPYNIEQAKAKTKEDAALFLGNKTNKLLTASELLEDNDVSMVCTYNANMFGKQWSEGIDWLEQVFRQAANQDNIEIEHCNNLIANRFSFERVLPYISSDSGTGYGENLLDSSNGWMLRFARKSAERMIDLSSRFVDDTGLKARSLNLGAKEVLLALSSDWAKMTNERSYPEYAQKEFTSFIANFSTLFDSLGSNSISTEWLTNVEKEHTIFPWINYHVFSPKK